MPEFTTDHEADARRPRRCSCDDQSCKGEAKQSRTKVLHLTGHANIGFAQHHAFSPREPAGERGRSAAEATGGEGGEDDMNWFHRQVCRSGRWRRRVEGELLPWALQGVELGDDVLEIGPGPGVTTDVLRGLRTAEAAGRLRRARRPR